MGREVPAAEYSYINTRGCTAGSTIKGMLVRHVLKLITSTGESGCSLKAVVVVEASRCYSLPLLPRK